MKFSQSIPWLSHGISPNASWIVPESPLDHLMDPHPPPKNPMAFPPARRVMWSAWPRSWFSIFSSWRRGGCKNSPTFFAGSAGSMILVYIHCISMSLLLKIPVAGGSLGNRLREYVILRILYIYNKKYVFGSSSKSKNRQFKLWKMRTLKWTMNLSMNDGDLTVKNIKNCFLSIKHGSCWLRYVGI